MKKCSGCKVEKSADMFSKFKRSRDGLHAHCKNCNKISAQKSRKKNSENFTQKAREYRQKHPEQFREADRKYRAAHPEKARASTKKWLIENPTYGTMSASRRRARQRFATPAWITDEHREQIKELYEVARMFRLYEGVEYHVDHIVPLAGKTVCGLHVPWNMTVIKWVDNLSKRNLHWPDMPDKAEREAA
jgi:hypothetical protein